MGRRGSLKASLSVTFLFVMIGMVQHLPAESARQPTSSPKLSQGREVDSAIVEEWNLKGIGIRRGGMLVLGTWAVSNCVVSGYYMTQRENRDFYFHQMNVFWNTVNLAIAGFGYFGALEAFSEPGFSEIVREYRSFSRVLAFNAALDVGYVMAGYFMKSRGGRSGEHGERLIGYGHSLILQGSFLFVFDVILAVINQNALRQFAEAGAIELSAIPGGIGAVFRW